MEDENEYIPSLAIAFAWAINDYHYHPLNERADCLTDVSNLKLYRGIREPFVDETYEHPYWQMWTTNKDLARGFAETAGDQIDKGSVLEVNYSGQCVDLDDVYKQVLKDIDDQKVDLNSFPEISEALVTYKNEKQSYILPPALHQIVGKADDTIIVERS
jgi:hypothetical protein